MSQERLFGINAFLLAVVVALSALVDGNGRILGLSTLISTILAIAAFAAAFIAAGILIARGPGWLRGIGVLLVITYVVLLLPAILP